LPPAGSIEEARAFEWVAWLTNTVHIAYACLWRPERFSTDLGVRQAIAAEAKARIAELNAIIEQRLSRGSFAAGPSYSIADPFLLVFFRWANRVGLDAATRHPAWAEWARRMEQRPAVRTVLKREDVSLWR
jgi:glutathione S-transferase